MSAAIGIFDVARFVVLPVFSSERLLLRDAAEELFAKQLLCPRCKRARLAAGGKRGHILVNPECDDCEAAAVIARLLLAWAER